ncbi:MAG: DUF1285 domain-containing protein [Kiloniellaceae bacterium]
MPSCGDFDIRIARDGIWFYRGSPIRRKRLVKLFSTVLKRDENGEYWLVTPVERGRVIVDDAAFTAVELAVRGTGTSQVLSFRNNVDDWVEAGPEHPIRIARAPDSGGPSPYILIRDRLEALILRPVYYRLVELAVERRVEGRTTLGAWSKETFFPLGGPD